MTAIELGLLFLLFLVIMIYLGIDIVVTLLSLGFVGTWLLRGDFGIAGSMVALAATDALTEYEFGTIPLFVVMGLFITVAGLGRDTFKVAHSALARVPGGLGHATIGANTIFAAITGISIASASLFAKIAVPEMLARGYSRSFATGVVAGSSMLGMLIPPSVLLIMYALITENSVGDMYRAALVPGILLAAVFSATVALIAIIRPAAVGRSTNEEPIGRLGAGKAFLLLLPIGSLIAAVLGGIYGGIFTATEAGAVGAAGGLLIALWRRSLDWTSFKQIILDTGYITASLAIIVAAAMVFTRFLAMTGLPAGIADFVTNNGFELATVMAIYVFLILLLGTTLDASSILMIVVPVFAPALQALGADLVWVGIITILAIEVGLITPPMGLSVFVVKASLQSTSGADISLGDIFVGCLPFVAASVLVIALLVLFPILTAPI